MASKSDPHYSLTTYHAYIRAVGRALWGKYRGSAGNLVNEILTSVPAVRRSPDDMQRVERSLRRAWATENMLQAVHKDEFADARMASVPWLPSQVYYAVHSALDAALTVYGQTAETHTKAMNVFGATLAPNLTYPLGIACTGAPDGYTYHRMIHAPQANPNLNRAPKSHQDCCDFLAVGLRTTREFDARDALAAWLRNNDRKKIPKAQKRGIISRRSPTTIINILYRLRLRSNYGDVDLFLEEVNSPQQLAEFAKAYLYVMTHYIAAFEALIERKIGMPQLRTMATRFPAATKGPSEHFRQRWEP